MKSCFGGWRTKQGGGGGEGKVGNISLSSLSPMFCPQTAKTRKFEDKNEGKGEGKRFTTMFGTPQYFQLS